MLTKGPAEIVLSLASFFHTDYAPTQWQTYLVYLLFLIFGTLFVCCAPRLLPTTEKFFFWCSLLGFLVSFITMLAASGSKQSGQVVFVKYTNQTGWSDGMSFVIAVGSCMYAFLATDAATHIAEVRLMLPFHNNKPIFNETIADMTRIGSA